MSLMLMLLNVVPKTIVPAPLGNFEMQCLCIYPRPTGAESQGHAKGSVFSQALQLIFKHARI